MKTIDNDIKTGHLKKAYVLYGQEHYLIRQYRDKIVNAISSKDDTMNFASYEGADINQKEIIDLAETLPFFAEHRLILIENSGLFNTNGEDLADYLPTMPDSTYFVFVEEEIDKRSKLYKAAVKVGAVIEFKTATDEMLYRWIGSRIKKEGKNITQNAYQLFIGKTGTDMESIDKELEKLLCYCMDKDVIDVQEVEAVTTEQTQNEIFEMVDAIASHQEKKALTLYYDLLALKIPPLRIMYLITRQFHILMTVKAMSSRGFGNKDIASKAGCPEWTVRKYQAQCRAFSGEQLKNAVRQGTEYEESVKTGQMNDQMAVELFILQNSKSANNDKSAK